MGLSLYDVTPDALRALSDKELVGLDARAHKIWAHDVVHVANDHRLGKLVETLTRVHDQIVAAYRTRGLKHNGEPEIPGRTKKSIIGFQQGIAKLEACPAVRVSTAESLKILQGRASYLLMTAEDIRRLKGHSTAVLVHGAEAFATARLLDPEAATPERCQFAVMVGEAPFVVKNGGALSAVGAIVFPFGSTIPFFAASKGMVLPPGAYKFRAVPAEKAVRKAVLAYIFGQDDRVLVVHRRTPPMVWGPPAGFMAGSETPEETAKRVVAHETGIGTYSAFEVHDLAESGRPDLVVVVGRADSAVTPKLAGAFFAAKWAKAEELKGLLPLAPPGGTFERALAQLRAFEHGETLKALAPEKIVADMTDDEIVHVDDILHDRYTCQTAREEDPKALVEEHGLVMEDMERRGLAHKWDDKLTATAKEDNPARRGETEACRLGPVSPPFSWEESAEKGGPGSGNFGHAGRPGEVGGSSREGGGTSGAEPSGAKNPATDHAPAAHPRPHSVPNTPDNRDRFRSQLESLKVGEIAQIPNWSWSGYGSEPPGLYRARFIGQDRSGKRMYEVLTPKGERISVPQRGDKIVPLAFPKIKKAGEVDEPDIAEKGGPGSGNFGHAGRPGEVGGSSGEGGGGATAVAEPPAKHRALDGRMGGAAPGTKSSVAREWSQGEAVRDKEAFGMYPVQERDIDTYYEAMSLEGDDAKEMLSSTKMTKEKVYSEIAEARKTVLTSTSSKDANTDPATKDYKPERKALHERITSDLLKESESAPAGEKPEILLTGGLPGAGKSSMLKNPEFHKVKYASIDSDHVKELLAKEDGVTRLGAKASVYQKEADDVLEGVFKRAVAERKHILWDGTMKNGERLKRVVGEFHEKGYRVRAAFAELPMKKAITRALERFVTGGRFVDPAYIASHDHKNLASFEEIKSLTDDWAHYSNDVPRGTPAKLVARGKGRGKVKKEQGQGEKKEVRWFSIGDGEDETEDRLLAALVAAPAKPDKKGDGVTKEIFAPIVHHEERTITKAGKTYKRRLIYGVVYKPFVVDAQEDWTDPENIEAAAHGWMVESRKMKVQHRLNTDKVVPVESYIAPCDFKLGSEDVPKGSWVLVSKVNDEGIWGMVERRELTGYSLGGRSAARDEAPPRS